MCSAVPRQFLHVGLGSWAMRLPEQLGSAGVPLLIRCSGCEEGSVRHMTLGTFANQKGPAMLPHPEDSEIGISGFVS